MQSSDQYSIRQFLLSELNLYKAMRLEALQLEAGVYGSNHATESALTDEQWLNKLSNEQNAFFGLFCDGDLIGITGIAVDWNDPAAAIMIQSYIRKPYRGKGLSHLLYDVRLAWARNRGLQKVLIGHKESNMASKKANQRYNFEYTHQETVSWPDNSTEDVLYYELKLFNA